MTIRGDVMLCRSCGAENSALDLRCRECGAYIRDRVPAMDLFSSLWGMIERPSSTLLRFARSEQKNYVHLLFAFTGPLCITVLFSVLQLGDRGVAFSYLLLGIAGGGPVAGLLLFPLLALLLMRLQPMFGVRLGYRLTAGYLAYSMSPLMWASVLLVPLQLGIFGLTLFSVNPPAWSMQPVPFWLLFGLQGIAMIWSMLLLPLSLKVHGVAYGRGLLYTMICYLLLAALLTVCGLIIMTIFP
ncbi:hypothetical protein KQI65_05785 [bacterium]|nr:hypothetical protein [bacterium]